MTDLDLVLMVAAIGGFGSFFAGVYFTLKALRKP